MVDYQLIENYTKKKLEANNNGHGLDHALRVVNNIGLIASEIKCNIDICKICGYVHDLIDIKVARDVNQEIAELSTFLTNDLKLKQTEVNQILEICQSISFSKNIEVKSVEAKVVQDADRLDALGAIGIARTIEYSASVNRPIYIEGDITNDTALGHFHAKLYKLPNLMNFEISRQIANDRVLIMKQFEAQYINESKVDG